MYDFHDSYFLMRGWEIICEAVTEKVRRNYGESFVSCSKCPLLIEAKKCNMNSCHHLFQKRVDRAIDVVSEWFNGKSDESDLARSNQEHSQPAKSSQNYRVCKILDKENNAQRNGIFHGFFSISQIVPPSPLRGGHTGGVVSDVLALVEDEHGVCKYLPANSISFIDDYAKKIIDEYTDRKQVENE